jgi:hypothetical protein
MSQYRQIQQFRSFPWEKWELKQEEIDWEKGETV